MIQEVCYVDIDVWGAQADSCNQYLQKGRSVLIEGRLKFDTWEDASGAKRGKHSVVADRVVFLSSAADQMDETHVPQTKKSVSTLEPELEKELTDQLEEIKKKKAAAPKAAPAKKQVADSPGGEMPFKDEPPFEDELPF